MNAKDNQTAELLIRHCLQYPKLQLQDLFKFIYQSAFGCEHLIADPSAMISYIKKEAATAAAHEGSPIEALDGDYVRVYLDVLQQGVSAEALGMAFTRSAVHIEEGPQLLSQKLAVLRGLAAQGKIPFGPQETEDAIAAWGEKGFPAIHHSKDFNEAYRPAYRLVRRDFLKDLGLGDAEKE